MLMICLVGLFQKNNTMLDDYIEVFQLEQWCKSSPLFINVRKTKKPLLNHANCDQTVETVNCIKSICEHIWMTKLNFTVNVEFYMLESQRENISIRKLKGFGVSLDVLGKVYVNFNRECPFF